MKTVKFMCGLMAAAMLVCIGCTTDDPVTDNPVDEIPGPDGPETEDPVFENGLCIYEDGSVLVQMDNGVDRVNGLLNAIENCADKTISVTATGEEVQCSNVFLLENGGHYYCEGKWVIKNDVTVKAFDSEGPMPIIQILADETGNINADMIRLEANVHFEGLYFLGKEAMTGVDQQRMLRIDGENLRLTLDSCFADYCHNFFIYVQNTGSKIYLRNSTFRNMAYNASSNGRLIDLRKMDTDTVLINNCLVYNNFGAIVRFDGAQVKRLVMSQSTFYNDGTVPEIARPASALIENNIFANVGFRNAATAIEFDSVTQTTEYDDVFWNIMNADEETDISGMDIIIRNNNVFNTEEMTALYNKYPETALAPTELSEEGQYLLEHGKLKFENNFSEILAFDNPAPIHYDFIDLYMSNPDAPDETYVGQEWFVDEDGIVGIELGKVYTFGYSPSSKSATASTTGGKIGAEL